MGNELIETKHAVAYVGVILYKVFFFRGSLWSLIYFFPRVIINSPISCKVLVQVSSVKCCIELYLLINWSTESISMAYFLGPLHISVFFVLFFPNK